VIYLDQATILIESPSSLANKTGHKVHATMCHHKNQKGHKKSIKNERIKRSDIRAIRLWDKQVKMSIVMTEKKSVGGS